MKYKIVLGAALTAALISGCGANNTNMNDTAFRDRGNDFMEPARVNFDNNARHNERGIGITRTQYNNNYNDNRRQDEPRFEVADKAADRITDLAEVERANVIVTDNNAYVAAVLDNGQGELSRQIEGKISEQVKEVDPDIDNVYVSLNPDFNDRMGRYADDLRAGQPIEGFFDEFTETVRRIFPNQR